MMIPPNVFEAENAPRKGRRYITTGISLIGRWTSEREFDAGLRLIALGIDALLSAMEAEWLAINDPVWEVEHELAERWRYAGGGDESRYEAERAGSLRERRARDPLQVRDARLRARVARLREHPPSDPDLPGDVPWLRDSRPDGPPPRFRVGEPFGLAFDNDDVRDERAAQLRPPRRDIVDPVPEWSMLLRVLDQQAFDDSGTARIVTHADAAHVLDAEVDPAWIGCLRPDESHYLLTRAIMRALWSWASYLAAIWNEGYAMEPDGTDRFAEQVDELDALCRDFEQDHEGNYAASW